MKAVHPKTGKPISIIRTETQITKTNRTLLWHTPTLSESPRWQRWSVLVTDPDSLKTQKNPEIAFIYNIENNEEKAKWSTWLQNFSNETLLIGTTQALKELNLRPENYDSVLSTEDFASRYPFLPSLKDTDSITDWVSNIATLMRFHRIVSPFEMPKSEFNGTILNIAPNATAEATVPPVYLIQQYFESTTVKRQQEIDQVLNENIKCEYIDKIVLLNEKQYTKLPKTSKLEQVIIGKRLTYLDVIRYIKNSVPRDVIVVFSNSDIYLDETICGLYSIDLEKKFLSLLRYDITPDKPPTLFGPRPDSQDTWILWSSSIDFEPTEEDFGFTFGISGCDNAINVSFLRKKFIVANPALTIKTYHVHNSNVRTYVRTDVIDKPVFLYLTPTAIQEYNPLSDLSKYVVKGWPRNPLQSFTRQIKYVDKTTAQTICTMMAKNSDYDFGVDSANTFSQGLNECDNILYKFQDAYTMPSGLVCDNKSLFVGKHPTWASEWTQTALTVLTNTVEVPQFVSVYFPKYLANSAALWFLHYLPKVLTIRKHLNEKPEFMFPNHPDLQRAMHLLQWPERGEVKMTPYMEDIQYHSDNVYALSPLATKEVTAEAVACLRSLLPIKDEQKLQPLVVIATDRKQEAIITTAWANELIKNVFTRGDWHTEVVDFDTPTEKRLTLLMQADLLISPSQSEWEALRWSWLLKPGASVIELMEDTKPIGEHIHLAGAANLNYILVGIKREPLPYQRQHAIEDINKCCEQHLFATTLKAQVPNKSLPTIVLPSGKALTGIHTHSQDTFREMVSIWEERGYCNVERRDDTPFVWWSKIGDILLYDRPTLRWLQSNSPSYKIALYGNKFTESPTNRDRKWSFWGRSPRELEKAATISNKSYEERKTTSVFIGRIENGVQQAKRTTHNWQQAIELFHMPTDSTGGPYKYSQEKYLSILSNARFGLALPGFGPKCNREIEYFALGTVPIVTPDVDMTNYAAPPIHNIHYFVASTPEEVEQIVMNTPVEKWTEMSIAGRAWWRRYASAEGLFRLTWGIINDAILKGQLQ